MHCKLTHIRARVTWGGGMLCNAQEWGVNPKTTTKSLLFNWVVEALEKGHMNLHILLRFMICCTMLDCINKYNMSP